MRILGYGEDFLTFWAITTKLRDILSQLGDNSDPRECSIFYRPSFGRRAGKGRSEFGEFDALIVATESVYLVEAKWDGSLAHWPHNTLELSDTQVRRHEIFRWYNENWNGENWDDFARRHAEEFKRKFRKTIPRKGTLLTKNLTTILSKTMGKKVVDVLLFLHHKAGLPVMKTHFEKVIIKFTFAEGEYAEWELS